MKDSKSDIIILRILKNKRMLDFNWSGTIPSLVRSLSKSSKISEEFEYYRVSDRFNDLLVRLGFRKNDFNLSAIKHVNSRLSKRYVGQTIISFDEIPISKNIQNYVYQDLCVDYLVNEYDNNSPYLERSGFDFSLIEAMRKRAGYQEKYYKDCTGIFTMSKFLQDYMINKMSLSENKVHYVGAGVNLDVSKIDTSGRTGNKFLFVGKDFYRKGGDLVCKAFDILQKTKMSNAELYIIGPKSRPDEAINENIIFLGEQDSESVQKYFNLCDVFVMPSRFEAFGLVFIEALASGLPCIARKKQEMPHLIENNKTGMLLDEFEESPEILSEIMLTIINSEQIKENVINQRHLIIENYSWDKVADRMIQVIDADKNLKSLISSPS